MSFENNSIRLVLHPDKDTTLKNGTSGKRLVAIKPGLAELLRDYVDTNRHEMTDDYGRTHRGTMRQTSDAPEHHASDDQPHYAPCYRGELSPNCNEEGAKKCPEAVSPHAIRRGSITHFLTNDVLVEMVGDRMDVSRKVLDEHYDKRSQEVNLEQRRRYLTDI